MDKLPVFTARQRRSITNQKTANKKKRKRSESMVEEYSEITSDIGDDIIISGDDNNDYFEQMEEESEKIKNLKWKEMVRILLPKENPKFDVNSYSRGMLAELSLVHSSTNNQLKSDEVSMDPSCSTGKTVAKFNSELNNILSSKKIQSKFFGLYR